MLLKKNTKLKEKIPRFKETGAWHRNFQIIPKFKPGLELA